MAINITCDACGQALDLKEAIEVTVTRSGSPDRHVYQAHEAHLNELKLSASEIPIPPEPKVEAFSQPLKPNGEPDDRVSPVPIPHTVMSHTPEEG